MHSTCTICNFDIEYFIFVKFENSFSNFLTYEPLDEIQLPLIQLVTFLSVF